MLTFPTFRKCDGCGRQFSGVARICPECRARRERRRYWAQRRAAAGSVREHAPTPAQEAYRRGAADLYRAALSGDLD